MEVPMTGEQLSAIAGVLLSLIFSYTPQLRQRFDALDGDRKRQIMAASLVITATAIFALGCLSIVDTVSCDRKGAFGLIGNIIAALVANQAAYMVTPKNGHADMARKSKDAAQTQTPEVG
jgi:hypothetical protein